ncbi:MAG: PRC-barrel domain-containing protein [Sphingomonas bacterium]
MIAALGWVALAATCLAALMTAANLGARITGMGFVVFLVGAIAWCVVGHATGQRQLFFSNAFLAVVDIFGAWRWLYRRARADDAVEQVKSDEEAALFATDELAGKPLRARDGAEIGTVEGALADCGTGRLRFLIVRTEDDARTFSRLAWSGGLRVTDEAIESSLDRRALSGMRHDP